MVEDVLLARATTYLHDRIRQSVRLAIDDLSGMLRATKAAGTDHAFQCQLFAEALIYDVVTQSKRPVDSPSGTISQRTCPSLEAVARNIADKAAVMAITALESAQSEEGK